MFNGSGMSNGSDIPTNSRKVIVEDEVNPHSILRKQRLKNLDRIIIGCLNINSIKDNVVILVISETKIDSSFPENQFYIEGFTYSSASDLESLTRY